MIRSAWKIESNGNVKYDVTIPANTTATLSLLLPNENSVISESGKSVDKTKGIVSVNRENSKAVIELVSGKYSFEVCP